MLLTAQRVRSPDEYQGVNTFIYRHEGLQGWPGDAETMFEAPPGVLVFHSIEVPPGGNRVRSFLDLVAPDTLSNEGLDTLLRSVQAQAHPGRFPAQRSQGEIAWRLGMEAALAQVWRQELEQLCDHVRTCWRSYSAARRTPSAA